MYASMTLARSYTSGTGCRFDHPSVDLRRKPSVRLMVEVLRQTCIEKIRELRPRARISLKGTSERSSFRVISLYNHEVFIASLLR